MLSWSRAAQRDRRFFMTLSRRFLFIPLAALALALGLTACGGGSSGGSGTVPSDAVAKVGNQEISRDEFNAMLESTKKSWQQQKRTFPKAGTTQYVAVRNQIMQYLVQRTEFEEKAKSDLGIEISDKQVSDRLAQIKKQYFGGSEKKYEQQIKSQGLTQAQVEDSVRSQLLSEAIFKKVTGNVKVSDTAIAHYYQSHLSQYKQPASRDVRHILVKTKAKADQIEQQLKNGADFATLAKKYSTDTSSKSLGGRLPGGITRGQTVPPFDKAAFSLKVNQISQPVHSQYGWHIIQALSPVRKPRTTPLSQVKAAIQQQLLQQQKNDTMTKWVDDVKKEFSSKVSYAAGYAPPASSTTTGATTTG
jgi:parvulin-like peptidyl-prolyl isomerase